jgi:putative addiction module component (TIGR02574 family)
LPVKSDTRIASEDACAPVPVAPLGDLTLFSRPFHGQVQGERYLTAYLKLDRTSPSANHSSMSLASIQSEIEKLDPSERASLIDLLWESLDEKRVKEVEAKWAAESEDRIDAFERGELTAVDGPSAIEELRSSLRK